MSSWNRHLALPACIAMACALPSCVVTWHTGDYVRKGVTVCKGFDTLHPVGGKVYVGADGESYYMQAQEVSYTTSPRMVKVNGTHGPKMGTPAPTGRTAWVQVKPRSSTACPPDIARKTGLREVPFYFSDWVFYQEVPALPGGARLWNTGETSPNAQTIERIGQITQDTPQTTSTATKVLTAPLDYVVDPVLSTASSATYIAGGLCAAAAYVTFEVAALTATIPVGLVTFGHINLVRQLHMVDRDSVPPPYDPEKEARIVAEKRGASFLYAYIPRGKGKEMSDWKPTYLPAPYLRKVIDTGVPLVLDLNCRLGASDKELEAIINAALAPLQAQGIRIHRATIENGKKRINRQLNLSTKPATV